MRGGGGKKLDELLNDLKCTVKKTEIDDDEAIVYAYFYFKKMNDLYVSIATITDTDKKMNAMEYAEEQVKKYATVKKQEKYKAHEFAEKLNRKYNKMLMKICELFYNIAKCFDQEMLTNVQDFIVNRAINFLKSDDTLVNAIMQICVYVFETTNSRYVANNRVIKIKDDINYKTAYEQKKTELAKEHEKRVKFLTEEIDKLKNAPDKNKECFLRKVLDDSHNENSLNNLESLVVYVILKDIFTNDKIYDYIDYSLQDIYATYYESKQLEELLPQEMLQQLINDPNSILELD
jgi:hypothetical protein